MKATVNGVTVVYIGIYYEWSGTPSTMVSYYYAGSVRIAMRVGSGPGATGLSWLVGDHLGSTSVVADNNGASVGGVTYKPWGETESTWGTVPTKRLFTGQMLEVTVGLYFFNARWYDSSLGRFIQPDIIVPDPRNPLGYDRYSYVFGNPFKFVDPTGNWSCQGSPNGEKCEDIVEYWLRMLKNSGDVGRGVWEAFMELDNHLKTLSQGSTGIVIIFGNTNGAMAISGTIRIGEGFFKTIREKSTIAVFAHEFTHLKQGFWTSISTMGEIDAYRVQYYVLKELYNNNIPQEWSWLSNLDAAINPNKFSFDDVSKAREIINKTFPDSWLYEHEPYLPLNWGALPLYLIQNNLGYPAEVNWLQKFKTIGQNARALKTQQTTP